MASLKFDITGDNSQALRALQQIQEQANRVAEQMKMMSNFKLPAVESLSNGLDNASKSASNINNELKGMDKVADSVSNRVSNFAQQFTVAQLAVEGINKAINAIKSSWGYLTSFQSANQSLSVVTGRSKESLTALIESAKDFGAASIFSATQVTQLQTSLIKLGFTEQEVLKMTKSLIDLATVSGLAPEKAATELATIMRMFGATADEAGKFSQALGYVATKSAVDIGTLTQGLARFAPTAQQFGMSINDILAMVMKLSEAGVKGSRAMMSLNTVFYKMSQSKVSGLVDVRSFDDFIDRLRRIGQDSTQFQKTMKDVGAMGSSIFGPLINSAKQAEGGILSLRDKLNEVGSTAAGDNLEGMANKMTNTISGAMAMLESTWERFVLELGDSSLGPVKDTIDLISSSIDQLTKLIKGDFEEVSDATYLVIGSLGVLITTFTAAKVWNAGVHAIQAEQIANYKALELEITKLTELKGAELDATMSEAVAEGHLTEAQAIAIQTSLNKAEAYGVELKAKLANIEAAKAKLIAQNQEAHADMISTQTAYEKAKAEAAVADANHAVAQTEFDLAVAEHNSAIRAETLAESQLAGATTAQEQALAEEELAAAHDRVVIAIERRKVAEADLTAAATVNKAKNSAMINSGNAMVSAQKNYNTTFEGNRAGMAATTRSINEQKKLIEQNNNAINTVRTNVANMGKTVAETTAKNGAAVLTWQERMRNFGSKVSGSFATIGKGIASMTTSLLSSPLLWIAGTIWAVSSAISWFKASADSTAAGVRAVNAEMEEYNRHQQECMQKTNELVGVINDENKSMLEKYEAYKKMKEMYESLGNMTWEEFASKSKEEQEKILSHAQIENDVKHTESLLKLIEKTREYYKEKDALNSSNTWHDVGTTLRRVNRQDELGLTDEQVDKLAGEVKSGTRIGEIIESMEREAMKQQRTVLFDAMKKDVDYAVQKLNSGGMPEEIANSYNNIRNRISELIGQETISGKHVIDPKNAANLESELSAQIRLYEAQKNTLEQLKISQRQKGEDVSATQKQIDAIDNYLLIIKRLNEYTKKSMPGSDLQKSLDDYKRYTDEVLKYKAKIAEADSKKESADNSLDKTGYERNRADAERNLWFAEQKLEEVKNKILDFYSISEEELSSINIAFNIVVDQDVKDTILSGFREVEEAAQDLEYHINVNADAIKGKASISAEEAKNNVVTAIGSLESSAETAKKKIQDKITTLEKEADKWAGTPKEADIRANITQAQTALASIDTFFNDLKKKLANPLNLFIFPKIVGTALEDFRKLIGTAESLTTKTAPPKGDPNALSEQEQKKKAQAEKAAQAAKDKAEKAAAKQKEDAEKAKQKAEQAAQKAAEKAKREQEKRAQAAEKLADKLVEAELKLQDLNNSLIKEDYLRERAELTTQWERDLKKINDDLREADEASQKAGKGQLNAEQREVFQAQMNARTAQYDKAIKDLDRQMSAKQLDDYINYLNTFTDAASKMSAEDAEYLRSKSAILENPDYQANQKAVEELTKQIEDLDKSYVETISDNTRSAQQNSEEQKRVTAEQDKLRQQLAIHQRAMGIYTIQLATIEQKRQNQLNERYMADIEEKVNWAQMFDGLGDLAEDMAQHYARQLGVGTESDPRAKFVDELIDEGEFFKNYKPRPEWETTNLSPEQYRQLLQSRAEVDRQAHGGFGRVDFQKLGQDLQSLFNKRAEFRTARDELVDIDAAITQKQNDLKIKQVNFETEQQKLPQLDAKILEAETKIKEIESKGGKGDEPLANVKARLAEYQKEKERINAVGLALKAEQEGLQKDVDNANAKREETRRLGNAVVSMEEGLRENAKNLRTAGEGLVSGIQELGNASNFSSAFNGLKQIGGALEAAGGTNVAKPVGDAIESVGKMIGGAIGGPVGDIIGGMGADLILGILDILSQGVENLILNLVNLFAEAIKGILNTVFDAILKGKFFEQLYKIFADLLKTVVDKVTFGGFSSWGGAITGSNAKKVAEREAKLSKKYDRLTEAIDNLRETIKGSAGMKTIKAVEEAKQLADERSETMQARISNQMSYHDAHHSIRSAVNNMTQEEFRAISDYVGKEVKNAQDIEATFTAEDWRKLRGNYALWDVFTASGNAGYWDRVIKLIDEYIDIADEVPELTEQLNEALTQTSFEGLRDNFISTLMDMDADAETFSENFSEYMMKAMLTNKVADMLENELNEFYETWAKYSRSGYTLTDGEIASLRATYDGIVEDGLAMRDELAKITGYDQNTSASGTSKGVQGMTQDTAEELNGRFTALQISNESINQQMAQAVAQLNMIGAMMTANNPYFQDMRAIAESSNSYLADIAKYNKSIYLDFSEKLDKVITNTNRL